MDTTTHGIPYPEPDDPITDYPAVAQEAAETVDSLLDNVLGRAQITAPVTLNQTAEASAVTIVTAPSVALDGATAIEVEFTAPGISGGGGADQGHALLLFDNGVSIGYIGAGFQTGGATYVHNSPITAKRAKFTPAAGAHVYSIRGIKFGNNSDVRAGAGGLGAYTPAQVVVRKVRT